MGSSPSKEEIIGKLDKLDQEEREINKKLKLTQIELNDYLIEEDKVYVKDDLNESDPPEEEIKPQGVINQKKEGDINSSINNSSGIDEFNSSSKRSDDNLDGLLDSSQEEHDIDDSEESNNSLPESSKNDEDNINKSDDTYNKKNNSSDSENKNKPKDSNSNVQKD